MSEKLVIVCARLALILAACFGVLMANRNSKRRKAKRRKAHSRGNSFDIHGRAIVETVERHSLLMQELADIEDPLGELDRRLVTELAALREELAPHRPERVVELARLACLPWTSAGQVKPDAEGGATKVELLSLLAESLCAGEDDGSAQGETPNSLYRAAHRWAESAEQLILLAQTRELLAIRDRPAEDLSFIAYSARSASVWIRSSSYADMVRPTYEALFGQEEVKSALVAHLGFDATDAIAVLTRLHDMQVDAMNQRMEAAFRAPIEAYEATERGQLPLDAETRDEVRATVNRGWQPTADLVAVPAASVADSLGLGVATVNAVLDRFSLDPGNATPRDVVDRFISGDNPLRTNPVIRTERETFMLVHDALVLPAIRENLEQELKGLPEWDRYQRWRGTLLEDLGRGAFEILLPGSSVYASFEYFVPANEHEEVGAVAGYSKKVEGDILFVLDDVAVIVEAKAVAFTPASRAGETRRLRRDLTGIITNASAQASRLQERIEQDGGVRIHPDEWLDLSQIREIHTVALSLEDLSGIGALTSDLVAAALLEAERIPWVVSIHDLQVIAQLVDRPAEFLLYLRRRRDPEVSLVYVAPDELDLFLYFYEAGLYVAPDPIVMAAELPYLRAPRPADVRRRKQQVRSVITSRTDPLDAWHYATLEDERTTVPKPALTGSPMAQFVDELQRRQFFAWLSTGATLLSASTKVQTDMSRIPAKLLAAPNPDGRERTYTVPLGSRLSEAWLLVWMTRPAGRGLGEITTLAEEYVRAKKYQLKFSRGAVFIFDEQNRALTEVVYNGTLPTPDPAMDLLIEGLFPPNQMTSPPPPLRPKKARRKKGRGKHP